MSRLALLAQGALRKPMDPAVTRSPCLWSLSDAPEGKSGTHEYHRIVELHNAERYVATLPPLPDPRPVTPMTKCIAEEGASRPRSQTWSPSETLARVTIG